MSGDRSIAAPRRRALQAIGAFALLLGRGEIAFGASIVAVRLWPADDYTRVTIESDTKLSVRHFMIAYFGKSQLFIRRDIIVKAPFDHLRVKSCFQLFQSIGIIEYAQVVFGKHYTSRIVVIFIT